MNRRTWLLLIPSLAVILVLVGLYVFRPPARVRLEYPSNFDLLPRVFGRQDTLKIVGKGLANVGAFQFTLAYDSASLHIDTVLVGDFLKKEGRVSFPLAPKTSHNLTTGKDELTFAAVTLGSEDKGYAASGEGTLALVIVRKIKPDSFALHITAALLTEISGKPSSRVPKLDVPK